MSERIRLVIADDTDIAREGLERILNTQADMEVVGIGTTIHDTVEKVRELQPDILLLDLKWFDDDTAGVDAIRRLTSEVPGTKVLAITVYPHLVGAAKEAGAVTALPKEVSKQQLIEEIRSVYNVPRASPNALQEVMPPIAITEELTERENEVMALLVKGWTDRQIAKDLHIAHSTAKNHVSNILGKLGAPNRARAVALALQLGLVEEDST